MDSDARLEFETDRAQSPSRPTAARPVALGLAGLAFAGAGRLLAEIPALVEWHRTVLFPWLSPILQWTSGSSVSTVGEVGAVIVMSLATGAFILRGTRVIGALVFLAGLLVFVFYGSWGLAYRYSSLSTRLVPFGASAEASPSGAALAELAERSAELVAHASAALVFLGTPDAEFLTRVNSGLNEGFARLPEAIEAAPVGGQRFGSFKLSRVSFALSRLQLSGYYFPWTGEAQINAEMPRSLWARVGAHEKAHQRGFARENEATVIGVLACLASTDPIVFYSGALGLFVSLDRDLALADPKARQSLWAGLPKRVVDDFRQEAAFWKAHEGVAGVVSEKVNDAYLKAQGVASGVGSYSETTRLFMQAIDKGLVDFTRGPERK